MKNIIIPQEDWDKILALSSMISNEAYTNKDDEDARQTIQKLSTGLMRICWTTSLFNSKKGLKKRGE